MKLKLEEEYSHLKIWSMSNVSCEWDSFYCFLLILLVSILFSVSNLFFLTSDYWSLQWGKTDWIQFAASDSTQQERLLVSLVVGRIYFSSLNLSMQRRSLQKKQTNCQCKSRQVIRFHRAEITYFKINRLYAYVKQIQQADYMRRNSLLIKVQI